MSEDANITEFMRNLLYEYKQIRGKNKNILGKPFWDLVVITTADEAQKEAFELQIDEKRSRQELPLDLPIHVVSDPPGVRIGNGGSTLVALEYLDKIYCAEMYAKKILLIHAGGWSQRMPSSSVLGKVFSLLPHGNPPYQMLDLKLALYWPLVDKIEPGVFLACADDFLVYSFGSNKDWKIPSKGFTALAHPSPIKVGQSHGVFVVKDEVDKTHPVDVRECLQALQKYTVEKMISHGALINGTPHIFAGGIAIEGEAVYTDSSFYFGTDVMKKLLGFKKSVGDIGCEIDAYGDFLQSVGSHADRSYIQQTSNISQLTSNLQEMRKGVFDSLNGSEFHVLILNASAFIHIGTTAEFLYHFCMDSVFQDRMAFEKNVFNGWTNFNHSAQPSNSSSSNIAQTSCIMHSLINSQSAIDEKCVIEYCDFEVPVQVSSGCILSNCQLTKSESTLSKSSQVIPSHSFLHTVPIFDNGAVKFVTIFFNIRDDLKKSTTFEELENLPFMDSDIGQFLLAQGLTKMDIIPRKQNYLFGSQKSQSCPATACPSPQASSGDCGVEHIKLSLWNLKLYPAKSTMTASLEDAILSLSSSNRADHISAAKFSVADLLKVKDVRSMLKFRKALHEHISELQSD
ncbi:unnamed protein product [Lymnaea stagnalis]|uniref:GDP-fucose pyrophosphorylase domain-containing protein n=1 Tax=Lymnaea stagnalis TaxID=6523 RepID=A0AAV2HB19_LYMST